MKYAGNNNIPEIIHAAAGSNLGIFALMIVALALLGFVFFRTSPHSIRVGIFVLLFAGVSGFGFALMQAYG